MPFSPRSMERFRTRIPAARVREAVALLRRLEAESPARADAPQPAALPVQVEAAGES